MRILVTGVAGFIGFHLANKLLQQGHSVTGMDKLDSYYDVNLKKDRLKKLQEWNKEGKFSFEAIDLRDARALQAIFEQGQFSHVVNLAAQAGVRYSLVNPAAYIQSNLEGFANLLEAGRRWKIEHLVYASSSSIYGLNGQHPYSPHQNVDHPVSLYAATKKSNELLAHSYSHLYDLPTTGLRFFTVYGPWGRPDMAAHIFTKAILRNKPIKLFNQGKLERDFTYVDDIVEGVARVIPLHAEGNSKFDPVNPDPATSFAPWRIYNIGNGKTIPLLDFVNALEKILGKKAIIEFMDMQPGDVKSTLADNTDLAKLVGPLPTTDLEAGLTSYVQWHRDYYGT